MTHDEIIEMARQAGIDIGMWEKLSYDDDVFGYGIDGTHENLEAFAKLVAAKEREANIKIIKETPFSNWFQADVIEAIRARGEQA